MNNFLLPKIFELRDFVLASLILKNSTKITVNFGTIVYGTYHLVMVQQRYLIIKEMVVPVFQWRRILYFRL